MTDATQWRSVGASTLDTRWRVRDGELVLTAAGGGDIISVDTYGDFELELEWRLPAGGNSGLFYRAVDASPIWSRAVEYQAYDTESDDWRRRVAASKFAGQAEFARARRGHLGLQDHGNTVRVRGMRIRALGPQCP